VSYSPNYATYSPEGAFRWQSPQADGLVGPSDTAIAAVVIASFTAVAVIALGIGYGLNYNNCNDQPIKVSE
jgi:hypothetical protein